MDDIDVEILPVIFSNLQKAAEKQQDAEAAARFGLLASEYDKSSSAIKDYSGLRGLVSGDLALYTGLQAAAEAKGDRGAQRALRWGQKVTAIQKSLIDRYSSKGEALLEDKELYVCEACGFIFLGDIIPEICPVCKAPSSRFSRV